MVDLDAFKRVNDTAGHAAGDQTLIEIAGILRRTRRDESITARIGGEEFVIAVVGTEQAAIGMAERLRRQISATTRTLPPARWRPRPSHGYQQPACKSWFRIWWKRPTGRCT